VTYPQLDDCETLIPRDKGNPKKTLNGIVSPLAIEVSKRGKPKLLLAVPVPRKTVADVSDEVTDSLDVNGLNPTV